MASALTLATTMSMPPSSPAQCSTQARRAAWSEMSAARPTAVYPSRASAARVSLTSASVRAQNPTDGALGGQALHDGPADALGPAGDQGAQPLQAQVHAQASVPAAGRGLTVAATWRRCWCTPP